MIETKKVVLVNPPLKVGYGVSYGTPPLGLLYLAASLRKNNISVAILDFSIKKISLKNIVNEICKYEPQYVGLSVLTDKLEASLQISREVKIKLPDIKVMFGGPHLNSTKHEIMSDLELGKFIDAVFVKESEETIVQYIRGDKFEDIPGLCYRDDNGKISSNKSVIPDNDLDLLDFPDLQDIKNVPKYSSPFFRAAGVVTMMTSRGCPFTCKFCDVHQNMGKKYRLRTPENIVEEILFHIKHSGVRNFIFKDSLFNLYKKHTIRFCNLIIERKIKISWMCNSRVNTITDELAAVMARAGCRMICFGVESLDPQILKEMNKKSVAAEIKNALGICRLYGIRSLAYMMVGCEGETYQSNMSSLGELIKLNPTIAEFNVATLYPGTALYEEAIQRGVLEDRKWYYAFAEKKTSYGYLSLPSFSVEEQIKAANESYKKFYFRPTKMLEILTNYLSFHLVRVAVKFIMLRENLHKF